jgi:hypothetical protein
LWAEIADSAGIPETNKPYRPLLNNQKTFNRGERERPGAAPRPDRPGNTSWGDFKVTQSDEISVTLSNRSNAISKSQKNFSGRPV